MILIRICSFLLCLLCLRDTQVGSTWSVSVKHHQQRIVFPCDQSRTQLWCFSLPQNQCRRSRPTLVVTSFTKLSRLKTCWDSFFFRLPPITPSSILHLTELRVTSTAPWVKSSKETSEEPVLSQVSQSTPWIIK